MSEIWIPVGRLQGAWSKSLQRDREGMDARAIVHESCPAARSGVVDKKFLKMHQQSQERGPCQYMTLTHPGDSSSSSKYSKGPKRDISGAGDGRSLHNASSATSVQDRHVKAACSTERRSRSFMRMARTSGMTRSLCMVVARVAG